MTKPVSSTTLKRMAYVSKLETEGHRQIFGSYADHHGGACALQLLLEICGLVNTDDPGAYVTEAAMQIGDQNVHGRIMEWNDTNRESFAAIANKLRSRWELV